MKLRELRLFGKRMPDIEGMRSRGDVPGLMRALVHDSDEVEWRAAAALGSLGKPALDQLHQGLYSPSVDQRIGIVEALAEIRDPRSTQPLIDLLGRDAKSEVRFGVAIALGEIGDQRALWPLRGALRDPDKYVRYGAAIALEKLGWLPVDPIEAAHLAVARQDWETVVRIGEPAIGVLSARLSDRDERIRKRAVELLGRIGSPDAAPACQVALRDANPKVRWAGVMTGMQCGIASVRLPWGVSKRPRVRKNPTIAAILNFAFPGTGYNYVGRWWGSLLQQSFIIFSLFVVLLWRDPHTYLALYPFNGLFSAHAWYIAKQLPEL